jgi:hypothetical protein
MIDTENSADLGFAHSMQSLKDIKDTNLLFTAYGLEADCGCTQSPSFGSSLLEHPLGSYTDNLNDQIKIKGFEHVRDREDFAGFHNQVGDIFDGLHGSEALDKIPGFSNTTEHGPDNIQSSIKNEQDIFDFLNRSPSGQVQGSGTKGTSGFSGVSLSGSDSVTGIGNDQGSSESDLWGRIEGSIADQYNTSPTGFTNAPTSWQGEVISFLAGKLGEGVGAVVDATLVPYVDALVHYNQMEEDRADLMRGSDNAPQNNNNCPTAQMMKAASTQDHEPIQSI